MDISGISDIYSQYAQSVADSNRSDELKRKFSADGAQTDEELMGVCKEFEAYFIEQMYKEMLKTVPESDLSSKSNSTLVDFFKDQAVTELSKQTSEQNGGLGLAQMLYEQMKRNYDI